MKYTKPIIFAQSKKSGSFAAGCPANYQPGNTAAWCKRCERTA